MPVRLAQTTFLRRRHQGELAIHPAQYRFGRRVAGGAAEKQGDEGRRDLCGQEVMKFACPNCGQRLEAESGWVGRQITCPTCSTSITVPGEAAPAAPQPVTTVEPQIMGEQAVVVRPRTRRVAVYSAAAAVLLVGIALAGRWFFTPKAGASSESPAASLFSFFDRADLVEVKVFPGEVHLGTKQDRQSVVVQAIYADGATRDATPDASFSVANKSLVRLDKDTLYPAADGKTELQVKFSGKTLVVPVTVESAKVERPISFRL